jgi:lysine-specific permease
MCDNEKIQVSDQTTIENAESFSSDASSTQEKGHSLQRGLKARHIQMIALGGTIGKYNIAFDIYFYKLLIFLLS